MRKLHHLALASTLACLASAADAGVAPSPETSDQTQPEQPQPDPAVAAPGNDPTADPNAPTRKADAEKIGKKVVVVWCQPGHETMAIGQLAATTAEEAEVLRGAGRVRYASDAEVKAAKSAKADILDLSGI
jgi:hypothetical protein